VAGDRAVVGASTAGERRWKVEDELTGGVGGAERETSACVKVTTPIGLAHWTTGGREGARVGADRRDPPFRHRGRAGARRDGLSGPTWLNWVFPFLGNF
jgi:hypothetical protein